MSKYRIKEFKGRFEVQEYHDFIFFGYWKSKMFIVNTILTKSFASLDDALKSVDLMIEKNYKDKKYKPVYHDVEDLLHDKGQIELIKNLRDDIRVDTSTSTTTFKS